MHIDRCTRNDLYRALMQIGADVESLEKSDPPKRGSVSSTGRCFFRQLNQWKFGEFTN